MTGKVWQARFAAPLTHAVDRLNRSAPFDWKLWPHDLAVSRAWADALHQAEHLPDDDLAAIVDGLSQIGKEFAEQGAGFLAADDEDIHMGIERRLLEIAGPPALKLHYGRSRNDMVATDVLLYLRDACERSRGDIKGIAGILLARAEAEADTPFPAYTHMQQAQPVSLGHILLAYVTALHKDDRLLQDCLRRMDRCPLGSGAVAGSPANVDRQQIATDLGFTAPTANSIEAVGSRDEVTDFLYACARLGLHLSRMSEDFILWSSQEFGYVTLDDSTATGSSMLPHKKNPDVFELARGKTGRLIGNLTSVLVTLKGLPSGYNKDLQEDKEAMFDTAETLQSLLPALADTLKGLSFNRAVIEQRMVPELKLERLSEQLVSDGVPFREAYQVAQRVALAAETEGLHVDELTVDDLQNVDARLGQAAAALLQEAWSIPDNGVAGGSSSASIRAQVLALRKWLEG
ncbi:MAG: argininosuccinate lyase [Candidatus Marinimicrobia bacterium]|nr:argininosuccinate lyase [Candidatus Neomarinimicrobiota bacterium]